MNKKTSGFETHRLVWAPLLILCALSFNACTQGSPQQTATPTPAKPKPALPSNAKLTLNSEPIGTTNDTSELSRILTRIFKERTDYGITKEGTSDIEKTLYLKADPSIRIGEILKVIDVAKEAGASPVLLPIEGSRDKAGDIKPDRLLLLLTIGNPESGRETISDGIKLVHWKSIKPSEKEAFKELSGLITVAKDGDYLIDEKPVGKSDLASELKSHFKAIPPGARTVFVLLNNDAEITYASLSEIAYAASEAYATELRIFIDTP